VHEFSGGRGARSLAPFVDKEACDQDDHDNQGAKYASCNSATIRFMGGARLIDAV